MKHTLKTLPLHHHLDFTSFSISYLTIYGKQTSYFGLVSILQYLITPESNNPFSTLPIVISDASDVQAHKKKDANNVE